LSQTVGIPTIGFITCGIYKIALYTVLQSAVDGDTGWPKKVSHYD